VHGGFFNLKKRFVAINKTLKILEMFFWAAGLVLVGGFSLRIALAELERRDDIETFNESTKVVQAVMVESNPDQSLWSEKRIAAYAESTRHDVGDILGVLSLPALDLEMPIYDGDSDVVLDRGIGRIRGTARPGEKGNLGIAGHRDGYFRVLKDAKIGDELVVKTTNGPEHYEITEISIVEPSDVHVLYPTEEATVTLVTCYPFYFVGSAPQRYIVRAELK
jgi:sortase A